ncbi:MAG: hypothetical protein ACQESR_09415 [Planctomycetota bacterium]
MRNCSATSRHDLARLHVKTRGGMTLLELMLVLALLVVMGALAMPSLRIPFDNQKLRKAGDVIRVAWNKARVKAMKTGQTRMFYYNAEEKTYFTQPHYSDRDVLEADARHGGTSTAGMAMTDGAAMAATRQADRVEAQAKTLPEGIVFVSSQVRADLRSMQLQEDISQQQYGAGQAGGKMTSGCQEIPPILFYPDGTTSDARLVLTNQHGKSHVVVSLRGLTGMVKVSGLVSADEVELVP